MPNYLLDYIQFVRDLQPYALRNRNDLRLPNFLTTNTQNSLIYKDFKLFNGLDNTGQQIKKKFWCRDTISGFVLGMHWQH